MSDKHIFLSYIFLSAQDECLAVPTRFVISSSLGPSILSRTGALSNARPWLVMADFLEAIDFDGELRMNAEKHGWEKSASPVAGGNYQLVAGE
jgi:hypothetical protein